VRGFPPSGVGHGGIGSNIVGPGRYKRRGSTGRCWSSKSRARTGQADLAQRVSELEKAQAVQAATQAGAEATQAATQAGAQATQAAAHAGTWAMGAGSVALVVGMFLGLAIGRR